ncbi:hypothetical protein APR41_12030 [Salegentibacter salinarum]|uniref:Glycosyltransferase 2-like domain-containing protein n=1 Tax=Salegentibacter salinarum TaxID=447422 RepID=A0A2N0U2B4_9FLAO|nr:hypothetical protein APR41_12030 [Salegentibacter salinarum]
MDDGSTDYTEKLMEFYCAKDFRIQFHHRPKKRRKGANACRNYGFELCKGKYIQWFDSDDLMAPNFLDLKVKAIEENKVDYVISKSANFKDPNRADIISKNEKYYRFNDFEITNYNYVTQKINWLTYDFLGKREVCEKVRFNETLSSGQEYNFFSKLTCFSVNGLIIDSYLTYRRMHSQSIRSNLYRNRKEKEELQYNQLETWRELSEISPNSPSVKYLFFSLIKIDSRERMNLKTQTYLLKTLLKKGRLHDVALLLCFEYIYKPSGIGYIFRKKLLQSIEK